LVQLQTIVMLFIRSTILFLINAVTLRPVIFRVTSLIILFSWIINTWEGIYEGLFQSSSTMYSFVLVLLLIAITFLINIYPRRLQEPMGPTLNKISYLVLTNILIILLGSLLVIFWVNSFAYDPSLFSLLVPILVLLRVTQIS